ncbi:MAG: hypothetical protein U1E78_13635 [Gammaproteobacteria bacterium]
MKKDFKSEFSKRLKDAMLRAGYQSSRSVLGVSPKALCDAIDGHLEMALRYLDGRSVPDPETLLKISEWLQVDPGDLLFGQDTRIQSIERDGILKIHRGLLEHAIPKLLLSYKKTSEDAHEKASFFISILSDLALIKVDKDQLNQIFDLAFKSSSKSAKTKTSGTREHGKSSTQKISRKVAS